MSQHPNNLMRESSKSMTGNLDFGVSRHRRGMIIAKHYVVIRMKESKVLALNLTGTVTELCRHLVLSGINLELVDDSSKVGEESSSMDFLFIAETDIGKLVR